MEVLDRETWSARADAHAARVDRYLEPHLARREVGRRHPVHDFLFTYYSHRPAQLRRWHPGYGVALADAPEYAQLKGYGVVSRLAALAPQPPEGPAALAPQPPEGPAALAPQPPEGPAALAPQPPEGPAALAPQPPSTMVEVRGRPRPSLETISVSPAHVAAQRTLIESLHRLLTATASRPAQLGCFGLHEWAMVYRLGEDETRHADWPLRLGATGTDAVVESHKIACSHFDAFRFFTGPARPRNTISPGRDDRAGFEQPGCLHANMDLYKSAFRLSPMICSDLVADCFELAREIREVDMRASPYDLADLGFDPIAIETPEGKRAYAEHQRRFAERAAPLRARLVAECELLLA